jgi:hypothetical protein
MSQGSQIIFALTQAVQALQDGDTETAVRVLETASLTCAEVERTGELLAPEELAQVEDLHHKCSAAAAQAREKLSGDLDAASRGRRASDAYSK